MRIQINVAVDFFYGGRDSYLVRRAECEFRVQRCRISSQQTNRTIVVQYVVILILLATYEQYYHQNIIILESTLKED